MTTTTTGAETTADRLEPMLTSEQARRLLNVPTTTWYRLLREGYLPAIRVGRQFRFRRSTLLDWITRQEELHAWRR